MRLRNRALSGLVGFGVILGCIAYEAGNILGGSLGLGMLLDVSPRVSASIITAIAATLLWFGSTTLVARVLGGLVAAMGLAFLVTAIRLSPSAPDVLRGALIPSLPADSLTLVVGLIGTTVVPYNLFLGSGLAKGHSLGEARVGMVLAIALGGLISMAIVVVAASVLQTSNLEELAQVLADNLGGWARGLFAFGLFAAGTTSAITAPLAAAYTARTTFGGSDWKESSLQFRSVWMVALAVGWLFGVSGVKAIPMIILAQVFNGSILPVVASVLLLTSNAPSLGSERNSRRVNVVFSLAVAVTVVLGLSGVAGGIARAAGTEKPSVELLIGSGSVVAGLVLVGLWRSILRSRQS